MKKLGYHVIEKELLARVPELAAHRPEIEGLPHVLFGHLARFVLRELSAPSSALSRALRLLEEALETENLHLTNLVLCAFVEHLEAGDCERLRALAGPRLRLALAPRRA